MLEQKTATLAANGSPIGWLDRGKEDVTPDLTPALFSPQELAKASTSVEDGGDIDDVLEEEAR